MGKADWIQLQGSGLSASLFFSQSSKTSHTLRGESQRSFWDEMSSRDTLAGRRAGSRSAQIQTCVSSKSFNL